MAQRIVNIGTSVNKGDGDPLRTAFDKINDNFTELYADLQNAEQTVNIKGSLFGDDSTLLVDGVNSTIPAANLSGSMPAIDGSALTGITVASIDFSNITNLPTTLAGHGITDVLVQFSDIANLPQTLQGYGIIDAASADGPFVGDLTGSVFADDSTLLIDGMAGTINASALTGALPAIDGSALTGITATANNLVGDMKGSVYADDSTLLVDGVSGTIPAANLTGALPAIDGSALTGVLTAGGDFEGNLSGSVFADDSTLLVDGVNGTLTAGALTGALPAIDGSALTDVAAVTSNTTIFTARADVDLLMGEVVYITGISGNTPTIDKAQANAAGTMPAFGIVKADVTANNPVEVVTFGSCPGHDSANFAETGITFALGDTVYVSATEAGKLTNVAPASESNLIQNIGKIERATPTTNMTLKVGGAGRTNATPALDEGNIFIGNAQNRSSTMSLSTAMSTYGGAFTGDLTGSVFADDSTVLVDSVNGTLNSLALTKPIALADDEKITFGDGDDLEIHHTGGVNYIAGAGGTIITGNWLYLRKPGSAENYLICKADGAVEVYYDNVKKLETTTDGVAVTGKITGLTDPTAAQDAATKAYVDTNAQAALVSGTNIKTVNGESLLGSGNITISGGGGGGSAFTNIGVGADDSTIRSIGEGESFLILGGTGITTASDAEGNITITASGGGGSGLQSRSTATATTSSIPDGSQVDLDITGFKSYALLSITTDRAARVRLYVSGATRSADVSRAEGVDPTSDAGLIAEVITTGAETVIISPGAFGFNLEGTPTSVIPCRVTNKSGSASTVQVDLNILQLEA